MVVHETIYKRLIAIGIIGKDGSYEFCGADRLKSGEYRDLYVDYCYEEDSGYYIISLAHKYMQNGYLMSDPYMEVRVIPDREMAEAMIFKRDGVLPVNEKVYEAVRGRMTVNVRLKKELNSFLSGWLLNLKKQGFKG